MQMNISIIKFNFSKLYNIYFLLRLLLLDIESF